MTVPLDAHAVPDAVIVAFGNSRERARSALQRHGLRALRSRVEVLAALYDTPPPGHLTVAVLAARSGDSPGGPTDPDAVRRIVETLTGKGLLHRLDAPGRSSSFGVADRPHHHAVCPECGGVSEIPAATLSARLKSGGGRAMFALASTGSLTLHERCRACAGVSR